MNLKTIKLWGWVKLIFGVAATGASAFAEAGGHVPPGVTAGIGAAAVLISHLDPAAGLQAAQDGHPAAAQGG